MDSIHKLNELGQSLWYDNIQRGLLVNGKLEEMIRRGDIRGITSNPSIFQQAIAKSNDYDAALQPMAWSGWDAEAIFYQLAIEDIRAAADLFRPLYDQTGGGDGYVSLEVSPFAANDTQLTGQEARRLWDLVDRPNLMIKIPATLEGIPAIRQTIAAGINVNITLIFSLARYALVMDAYLSGLEDRLAAGKPVDQIASVASFFVSRVDNKVDPQLQAIVRKEGPEAGAANDLLGKVAVANSRLAYELFQKTFASARFENLKKQGARLQRPLWASTSTKNPAYNDVLYVEELIAPDSINTVPPQTLDLFRQHGKAESRMMGKEQEAHAQIAQLESLGIAMQQVTDELEQEGVKAFSDAFTTLLQAIDQRRKTCLDQLGPLQFAVAGRVQQLEKDQTVQRMFAHDPALWTADPAGQEEIRKRMGWLEAPVSSRSLLGELNTFFNEIVSAGYTHVLLLGMGGSSLAPEVLASTFSGRLQPAQGLDLAILDSTDPEQVAAAARRSPVEKTLYVVSSKSGSTSEVNAYLDYFWALAEKHLNGSAGEHFIAITDPGTSLEKLAQAKGFRHIFTADPTVGGRNSALTAFGLVPAALIGLDVERLLKQTIELLDQCRPGVPAGRNPGLVLGAVMAEGALLGRDKLTIWTDPEIDSFGSWMEQLIAESSGKQGKGIIPIDLEPVTPAKEYSPDRLFVYMRKSGSLDKRVEQLQKVGQPVIVLNMQDAYEIGAEFYRWEVATAIACSILGVNSFDQPDVQDNKTRTQKKIQSCIDTGRLDEGGIIWAGKGGQVFGQPFDTLNKAASLAEVVDNFLRLVKPGDYVAINAYLPRNPKTLRKLQKLRKAIQKRTCVATTLGFGPRFLHSTGQLHKGGPDSGVFLQITDEKRKDLVIPGESLTFAQLERAQALGDLEALQARGRRAIRIHLVDGSLPDLT